MDRIIESEVSNAVACGDRVVGQLKTMIPTAFRDGAGLVMVLREASVAALAQLSGSRHRFAYHDRTGAISFTAVLGRVRPRSGGEASIDLIDVRNHSAVTTEGRG